MLLLPKTIGQEGKEMKIPDNHYILENFLNVLCDEYYASL